MGNRGDEPLSTDIDAALAEVGRMRDDLDAKPDGDPATPTGVIREIRVEGRRRLHAILDREDLTEDARAAVLEFYQWLCGSDRDREDPASWPYAKRLHVAVQRFGARVEQIVRNDLGGKTPP